MLWKGVYPYEYTALKYLSHLNMEDITDAVYVDAKRVGKDFKKKYENIMICMIKAIDYS